MSCAQEYTYLKLDTIKVKLSALRSSPFTTREKSPYYPLNIMLCGPQSRFLRVREENNLLPQPEIALGYPGCPTVNLSLPTQLFEFPLHYKHTTDVRLF